ncbi:MAG: hypothetical protein SFU86_15395 [Pirellulaceae bacterium]|nr:hypothetical protein [Pirellulaceae bacterium]
MLTSSGGYSSDVEMYLQLGSRKLSVGQVGPTHCILDEPLDCAPTSGTLVIVVDGDQRNVPVYLPDGASRDNYRVSYRSEINAAAER